MTEAGLVISEREELDALEDVIARGLRTFREVGTALAAIRDKRLYRAEFSTFEDYCQQRWQLSRPRAYQLIEAAVVAQRVSTMVDIEPKNERQIRPLTRLPEDEQPAAWHHAVETAPNGIVTAAHTQRVTDAWRPSREVESLTDAARDFTPVPTPEPEPPARSVHFSSDSDDWHTPPEIISRVLEMWDGIDLDPCSNEGKPNVPAFTHFTKSMPGGGLLRPWYGRVYLNPPYGDEISAWVNRLADAFERQEIGEAVALVPARTDTAWFRRLRSYLRCFVNGRLKFSNAPNSAPFPSVVFYLGERGDRFIAAFRSLGDVYEVVS